MNALAQPTLHPRSHPLTAAEPAATRILVVSHQQLVRDAVRTALRSMGFVAASLAVPVGSVQLHEVRRATAQVQPDVGMIFAEIDDAARLHEVAALVSGLDLGWVVLTTTPPGAVWGAVLDAGAIDIVPASTCLADLSLTLRRAAAGERGTDRVDLARMLSEWRGAGEDGRELTRRLEALSAREMEILVQLHEGCSVKVISARAGVSEGTVRTQVRSLLRKLQVSSQLQAVATYRNANAWFRA